MKSKQIYRSIGAFVLGLMACSLPCKAIQFRLLGWTSADVNLQCDLNNHTPTELTVLTDSFSSVYEYKGEGPLILYKIVEHEGKRVRQIACAIPLPPDMEQGLLFLTPGDESTVQSRKVIPNRFGFVTNTAPLKYNFLWLDDSPDARPAGTIEFRNMSSLPVALQIEATQLKLDPLAKAQTPMTPGASRMAFRAAAQINSQWKLFTSRPLPTRGPTRMMVIIKDGPPVRRDIIPIGEPNIQVVSLFDWESPKQETDIAAPVASLR